MKIPSLQERYTIALSIVRILLTKQLNLLGPIYVGRKNGKPTPQIVLGGVGILPNHAYFEQQDDGFIYLKASDEDALENIQVNGEKIQDNEETGSAVQRLFHLDRILFGSNTILVFKYPLMKRKLLRIKTQLLEQFPQLTAEELESRAKQALVSESLISPPVE